MPRFGGIDSQYCDLAGDPLSWGRLYFYETGTTTPKATYFNGAYDYPNPWPVQLDAIGVPPDIFYSGTAKIVLTDSDGSTIRTMDPVTLDEYEVGDTILYRLGSIASQFLDVNGDPLRNGKLYTYRNGTSTPKTTYDSNALDSANAWPVVLDENGFIGDVFYEGKARLVLTDADGVQQRELDEVETVVIDSVPGIILGCPDSLTVVEGADATFCVILAGPEEDYTIQWYQDLTLLSGETSECVTIVAETADNGSQIWVSVTDGSGVETCGYATLTVETPCEALDLSEAGPLSGVAIRSENISSSYNIGAMTRTNGMLAVNGDTVWQNQPSGSGSTDNPSVLYVTHDFGGSWSTLTIPYDDKGSTPIASYVTNYPDGLSWNSFKKINGHLYALNGDYNTRNMTLVSAVVTDTSSTAFSVATTQFNGLTTQTPYYGTLSYINGYNKAIGEYNGQVLTAGRPAGRNDFGIKIGEWAVADGKSMSILMSDFSLGESTNVEFIETVGDYIYTNRASSGGTRFVGALDYASMISAGTYRRYTNVSWTGSSWGSISYAGSYYGTGSRNDTPILSGLVSSYSWANGIIGPPSGADEYLVVPVSNYSDLADADYGKFYFIQGITTTLVDLSTIVAQEDAPNEGFSKFVKLQYVEELGFWIMLYGFSDSASYGPSYFYIRASVYPDDTAEWSSPIKVIFPDSGNSPRLEGGGPEGLSVEYSDTQDAFVFSAPITYAAGASGYKLVTFYIDNVFVCA